MKIKEISISKIIILTGLVTAIICGLFLGMENVALTGIGVIGGYLMKDIEIGQENKENTGDSDGL